MAAVHLTLLEQRYYIRLLVQLYTCSYHCNVIVSIQVHSVFFTRTGNSICVLWVY